MLRAVCKAVALPFPQPAVCKLFPVLQKAERNIYIRLQKLEIHTSCSKPLLVGDQFGSLILREIISEIKK